jgi:tetratricopeptide (TPR) repeat protein
MWVTQNSALLNSPTVSLTVHPLSQGDLAQAIAVFERGLAVCQRYDLRDWHLELAASMWYAYALVGGLSEAVPLLEQAIRQYTAMRGGP